MGYRDGFEVGALYELSDDYDYCVGKRGVVYILISDAFKDGWVKIGCTTKHGAARAKEINEDTKALTGLPAVLKCIFELRTNDCGTAERRVHHRLRHYRRGKHGTKRDGTPWGQEWFYVDLETAKQVINDECYGVDEAYESKYGNTIIPDEAVPQTQEQALAKEVERLQAKLTNELDEKLSLIEDQDRYKSELAGLQHEIKKTNKDKHQAIRSEGQTKAELETKLNEVRQALEDLDKANKRVDTLSKDKSAFLHAREEAEQQLYEAKVQNNLAEQKVEKLKQQSEQLQSEYKTKEAEYQNHLNQTQKQVRLLQDSLVDEKRRGEAKVREKEEDTKIQQAILHTRYQRQIVAEADATISQLSQVIQQAQARKQAALQQIQGVPYIEPTKKSTKLRTTRAKKTSLADMFFLGLFVFAIIALIAIVGLYVMRKMSIL